MKKEFNKGAVKGALMLEIGRAIDAAYKGGWLAGRESGLQELIPHVVKRSRAKRPKHN